MTALIKKPVKGALIPMLLLLIVVAVYFTTSNRKNAPEADGTVKAVASWKDEKPATPAVQKDTNSLQAQPASPNQVNTESPAAAIEKWSPMGDEVTQAQILRWHESRGNFDFEDPELQNDYKNYDLATLEKLGESGDLRALYELYKKVNTIEAMKEILTKAIAWGSSNAIIQAGLLLETEKGISSLSPEEKKPYILESLAYYEAAQIRGDWWGTITYAKSLLSRHPTELSQQDKTYIEQRGRELYNEFQKERYKIGLGQFDNSTPDAVIKFYEEMIRPR